MNTVEYVLKRPDGLYLGYFGNTRRQLRAHRTEHKGTAYDLLETIERVCGEKDLKVVAIRVRPPRRSIEELRAAFASFSAETAGWWPLEVLLRDLARHGKTSACDRELLGILERHPHFEGRGKKKRKSHPLFNRLEIPGAERELLVESLKRAPSFRVMRMLSGDGFKAPGAREALKNIALTHPDERIRRRAVAWYEVSGNCLQTGRRLTVDEWEKRHAAEEID